MYSKAFMPAVGENGGVHRVSGYHMGYAVDGVSPSTGSGQHGGRLPIDVGGANTGKSKVYAGNDMVALACGSSNQGVWFFTSTEPLLLVSGEICYILLECIHMTAADRSALGLTAGKTIPAGTWMYSEGTAGGASTHLHIDFGRAQDKPKAGKCPWHSIGGGSYAPDDNYPINRALFMPSDMTVYGGTELGSGNVRDNAGYIWHRDTGEQPIGEVRIGSSNYMRRTGPGTNYAVVDWGEHSADDCKALAGRLYAVYEVSGGWLRITQRGVGGANGQWISAGAGKYTRYDSGSSTQTEAPRVVIDVSKHQGDIDWAKVPYPAIIRVGYRGYGSGACTADEKFEQNITGAIASGKLYGFYFFSQAVTQEEAAAEAEYAHKLIAGRGNGLPLFIDCEWSNSNHDGRADGIDKDTRTACAEAFCEHAQACGYIAGVYTFTAFAQSSIEYATLASRYVGWLADTRANYDTALPRHIHQYGQGEVSGISGPVDLNRVVKEFAKEEAKPVNQLQKLCIVDANDTILERAKEAGLPMEKRTCYLIGPASNGDAMALWLKAQAEGKPYFSSYTEV